MGRPRHGIDGSETTTLRLSNAEICYNYDDNVSDSLNMLRISTKLKKVFNAHYLNGHLRLYW